MAKIFTVEELSSLLELLEKSNVTEFELEKDGEKLKLKRGSDTMTVAPTHVHTIHHQHPAVQQELVLSQPATVSTPPAGAPIPLTNSVSEARKQETSFSVIQGSKETSSRPLHDVKSPMVGTFYRRPAPDAKPYVDVGDIVKEGDVLCIVEAMKLMNEIEADVTGRVIEVCLDDSHMVEYGEVLFRIEPSL